MKQKVGIVAAFMHDPAYLLDSPGGLDPLMQNRFVELILQESKRKDNIDVPTYLRRLSAPVIAWR